jgi:carbon-monoxide dehydrogenase catalytic subunit
VDNSRILTVLAQIVEEGGLGDDISDVPAVGMAPEWMSEKALSIGTYVMASGGFVIFGGNSPISGMDKIPGSHEVERIMDEEWEELYGGKMIFVDDVDEQIRLAIEHIDKKRAALGLPAYDPNRFGKSGDWRVTEIEKLPEKERQAALYGHPETAGD